MKKKLLALALGGLMACSATMGLAACGGGSSSNKLVIWCQSSDVQNIAQLYFAKEYPDVELDITVYSTTDLQLKLDQAFSVGYGLPDVFAMEEAILKKYVESGALLDQTDLLTQEEKDATYQAVLEGGRGSDGKIYGYAYQICPGAFYYRTDIAKAVWPGYELSEIDEMIGESWESLLDMAATLRAFANRQVPDYPGTNKTTPASGITLVPGYDSLSRLFFAELEQPWVENNTLHMSDIVTGANNTSPNLFDMTKTLLDNGYCNKGENFLFDTSGFANCVSSISNFGFFLPSWGMMTTIIPQVMGRNTQVPDTAGLWRCALAPVEFAYGGTWLGIPKQAKNRELAQKFAKYVATDETFKRDYALNTMNFVNSPAVMAELAQSLPTTYATGDPNPYVTTNADGSTGFTILGGQNHYGLLKDTAQKFKGNKLSVFDAVCNNMAIVWSNYYALGTNGATTRENAINNLKAAIFAQAPGLK